MPASEVMHLFKEGKLHSGKSGKIVKSRKQAIAIKMSYERKEHQKNNSDRHAKLGDDGGIHRPHSQVSGMHRMMPGVDTTALKGRIASSRTMMEQSMKEAQKAASHVSSDEFDRDMDKMESARDRMFSQEDSLAKARKGKKGY